MRKLAGIILIYSYACDGWINVRREVTRTSTMVPFL